MLGWATIKCYVRAKAKIGLFTGIIRRGAQHEFTLSRREWSICHRVPAKYYPQ
jgi:hypothetical protein